MTIYLVTRVSAGWEPPGEAERRRRRIAAQRRLDTTPRMTDAQIAKLSRDWRRLGENR